MNMTFTESAEEMHVGAIAHEEHQAALASVYNELELDFLSEPTPEEMFAYFRD